jgi:hypothetical protein
MPIKYWIDNDRRLVWAKGDGTLSDQDVFEYQRLVWSRPEVAGYAELIDMSAVRDVALPHVARVRELASLSAGMDDRASASKLAIVAPNDLAFGLGRMYEAYRDLEAKSTKQVGVFRSLAEALAFLGVAADPPVAGAN